MKLVVFVRTREFDRVRQATHFRGVSVEPQPVIRFLIGRIHNHYRDLPIWIKKRR